MQAYGPTSGIKELQPWSPEFKGFDYSRSRPVDAFGNPVGWDAPTKTAPTMGANGVPSGWDPRDWENMKNTDLGSPSDEYILNNPWMGGMQLGNAPLVSPIASIGDYGSGISGGTTFSPRVQQGYASGIADKAAREAGAANNQTALNYALYGGPDAPEGAVTPEGFASKTTPSTGSTFLNYLNQNMAAPRGTSTAAPSGQDYSGVGGFFRGLGELTTPQWLNLARTVGSFAIPGAGLLNMGLGAAQGAADIRSAPGFQGNSVLNWLTSGPSSESAAAALRQGDVGNAFNYMIPFAEPTKKYADGGVNLEDGSFVVDARTVAELGNGSSGAGQELLARMGGKPIKGPGDGVSDSIRANIGGKQEARVARDEVKFSPEAVKRLGRGNPKKGADRLYAMMRKAEKARKTASRGKDTGLRALVGEK
jgi:hypothetical protein